MNAYTVVDVAPDTDAWLTERRSSVGASEVAAIMGLSKYATALDIYKSKFGVDREFDPVLGFIGHESEVIIAKWVEQFSGVDVTLEPAFMARSVSHPYLHASFDRVSHDPFTTWQFKTAHHHSGHHWDEGIPTDIRVQVQAEMFVAGTQRAAVVVWIGGREFRLFWEQRDNAFIDQHMLPAVDAFWQGVKSETPPDPTTLAEMNEVWPSKPDTEIEATGDIVDILGQYTLAMSDAKAAADEAAELKTQLAVFMRDHDTLTHGGKKLASFKTQAGRRSFDSTAFANEQPDLFAKYTRQGAGFKVLRISKGALDV